MPQRNPGQTSRSTRIVEWTPLFGDVGNTVLELDEDVGTMVETQAIARAQVLVDPHAHAVTLTLRTSFTSKRAQEFPRCLGHCAVDDPTGVVPFERCPTTS